MGKRMERRNDELNDKRTSKGGKSKVLKFFVVFFVVILVCTAAALGYSYIELTKITNKSKIAPKTVAITKPVNFLILGVDAGDYDNHTKNNPNRSDTMMLVRYNPKTNKIYMLSIPRDTKVTLHGKVEKLNASHAMGGAEYTISSIERLLNVDINYYAEINYEGFRECIDAIGGVDIKIPRDMDYDAWKISIHFKKGEVVHMDGAKAEEFVRWRKNNNGGGYAMGDLGRISTQQAFIVEVIKKLKTPSGMLRYPVLMNTVSKYLETNMPINTMLDYALKARGIKSDNVQKEILPGEAKYIDGISYYVWNKDKNNKFIANFRGEESSADLGNNTDSATLSPTDNENDTKSSVTAYKNNDNANGDAVDTPPPASADRSDMDVMILNSTGKQGLAAEYKTKLEGLGYKVVQTGNYSYKKYSYTIINDYSKKECGNVLYNDLKFGKIVKKQNKKIAANLVVILGTDSIK